ncbi:MAG: ankyrin repeat domain-containing protein [Epsilonproteobacteria bacterium]|nr:ankyrin repeat domain-containing protein [Campylobacterota bacterium]
MDKKILLFFSMSLLVAGHVSVWGQETNIADILPIDADDERTDQEKLFDAVKIGDIDTVKALISGGDVDLDQRDLTGKAVLHYAADKKDAPGLMKILVDGGADVNIRTQQFSQKKGMLVDEGYRLTPLHMAAANENEAAVEALLKSSKIDLNLKDFSEMRQTPLAYALSYNKEKNIANKLVDAGIEATGSDLANALKKRYTGIAKKLIQGGADVNYKGLAEAVEKGLGVSILKEALNNNDPDLLKLLMDKGIEIEDKDAAFIAMRYPQFMGVFEEKNPRLKEVFKDANTWQNIADKIAKGFLDDGDINLLQSDRIKNLSNFFDQTLLHMAVQSEIGAGTHFRIFNNIKLLLVDVGLDPNVQDQRGFSALHYAAEKGDSSIIRLVHENNGDLNLADKGKNTPLHLAVAKGKIEATRALIDAGADVNKTNLDGKTPLHVVVLEHKNKDFAAALFSALEVAGADLEVRDRDGKTPLHQAAGTGNIEMLERLVGAGADVNARENIKVTNELTGEAELKPLGNMPLHAAIRRGETQSVSMLLKNGADLSARDVDGKTPLEAAVSKVVPLGLGTTNKEKQKGFVENLNAKKELIKLLVLEGAEITDEVKRLAEQDVTDFNFKKYLEKLEVDVQKEQGQPTKKRKSYGLKDFFGGFKKKRKISEEKLVTRKAPEAKDSDPEQKTKPAFSKVTVQPGQTLLEAEEQKPVRPGPIPEGRRKALFDQASKKAAVDKSMPASKRRPDPRKIWKNPYEPHKPAPGIDRSKLKDAARAA